MDNVQELDILAIGNAIVDVFSQVDDSFLVENELPKGSMTLIDEARANDLYGYLKPNIEVSGGSTANSTVCAASLGSRVAYIGKVCDDTLGATFAEDIRKNGVLYQTPPSIQGRGTARCIVLVSSDGQRTMNTYLGACVELAKDDIDESLVRGAKITYIEGYLYDSPYAREAIEAAIIAAHDAGRQVALTLSDSYCVDRHRSDFRNVIENHVDVLLANEQEIFALYETDTLEETFPHVRELSATVAITRAEKGSVICADGALIEVSAEPVSSIVDSTGAGDAYAAGFLHGVAGGRDLPECGRLASIAATEIISHVGCRPQVSLAELAG
jgi:sugar/nucleoside kinase (ribokinase family)